MKLGKAFELFVKYVLINVGFSEINSDGLYIFDGAPGQMIQGLGGAHNADVLLEPPVQTPFYYRTRLLIECKDYVKRVGLNTVRSVLGLREDINHFNNVDINVLVNRRHQNRQSNIINYERFTYQVAIASINGYTLPAQEFAATYRIPLLEFNKMPFWDKFCEIINYRNIDLNYQRNNDQYDNQHITDDSIINFASGIGQRMAVAITNSGQMLFLYRESGKQNQFDDYYSLHWATPDHPWELTSGNSSYFFQLPEDILKQWLKNSSDELNMKKEAIHCKESYLSNMIVYYVANGRPVIKMISIDKHHLEDAMNNLQE